MEQNKFSIILPIYNREDTIKKCVDSILSQSYQELELLLVKVHSTDNTWKICKKYAGKDKRVRLMDCSISKGSSAERDSECYSTKGSGLNQALQSVQGRWLVFADGADRMCEDYLSKIYEGMLPASLIVSNYICTDRQGQMAYDEIVQGEMAREKYLTHLMKDPTHEYFGALWNKVYDLEIIQTHSIRFPDKVQWGEDFIFNMQYLVYAEKICLSDLPVCSHTLQDIMADITEEWHLAEWLNHRNYMYAAYKTLFWRLKCYDVYRKQIERYMLEQTALEVAHIILPFSFKGWCLIRKKCLQDNQLNTIKNRLWVIIKGVKLRL